MRTRAEPLRMSDYRQHLAALARMVRRRDGGRRASTELAPVISLAQARARRAGHPCAWSDGDPGPAPRAGGAPHPTA